MSAIPMHVGVLLVYVLAAMFFGAGLALRAPKPALAGRLLFILALALHTASIGAYCVQVRQSPFASSFGTLSIAAWTIALAYVPVEFIARIPALGALAAPVSSLLLFAGLLRVHAVGAREPEIQNRVISIHVMVILVSFALFALAACCAVFYLWQYNVLKHPNRRALFKRLPPLETVDSTAYHLVAFALPLLTIGLALGMVSASHGGLKGNWLMDPHTLMSFAAWVVYCAYLSARLVAGWRGARLNYLLLTGLAVTVSLYFVPTSTHRFPQRDASVASRAGGPVVQ